MQLRPRPQIDDGDARDDEPHPDDRGRIQPLAVHDQAEQRDQDDPDAGPDRVGDADRQPLEAQRQEVEGGAVAHHHHRARQQARESLGRLQRGGGGHLRRDGQGQVEEVHLLDSLAQRKDRKVAGSSRLFTLLVAWKVKPKRHPDVPVAIVLCNLRLTPVEFMHLSTHHRPTSSPLLHESHGKHVVRQRLVPRTGMGTGANALHAHVVGQRARARDVDMPAKDLEQHFGSGNGVVTVYYRVNQCLPNCCPRQQRAILAEQPPKGLESPKAGEPTDRSFNLLVKTSASVRDL